MSKACNKKCEDSCTRESKCKVCPKECRGKRGRRGETGPQGPAGIQGIPGVTTVADFASTITVGCLAPNYVLTPGPVTPTDANIIINVPGTGFLALQIPTPGSAVGGDCRGPNAVDLQLARIDSTRVAAGDNSFAANLNNRAAGTASAVFGQNNFANGTNSFAAGTGNIAGTGVGGANSFVIGAGNVTDSDVSFVAGLGNIIGFGSDRSAILAGAANVIADGAINSSIIVGAGNNILGTAINSSILSGSGFSAVYPNEPLEQAETALVRRLRIRGGIQQRVDEDATGGPILLTLDQDRLVFAPSLAIPAGFYQLPLAPPIGQTYSFYIIPGTVGSTLTITATAPEVILTRFVATSVPFLVLAEPIGDDSNSSAAELTYIGAGRWVQYV